MVFQIGIGIVIVISISDEDRDRDRDLDFGDRGHALICTYLNKQYSCLQTSLLQAKNTCNLPS